MKEAHRDQQGFLVRLEVREKQDCQEHQDLKEGKVIKVAEVLQVHRVLLVLLAFQVYLDCKARVENRVYQDQLELPVVKEKRACVDHLDHADPQALQANKAFRVNKVSLVSQVYVDLREKKASVVNQDHLELMADPDPLELRDKGVKLDKEENQAKEVNQADPVNKALEV